MPGQRCTVCGTSRTTKPLNPEETFHRRQKDIRVLWLKELSPQEDDVNQIESQHMGLFKTLPDEDATTYY